ncbi:MAG: hypothetical protein WKF37_01980 [Bryobacteraceae bacterium]
MAKWPPMGKSRRSQGTPGQRGKLFGRLGTVVLRFPGIALSAQADEYYFLQNKGWNSDYACTRRA